MLNAILIGGFLVATWFGAIARQSYEAHLNRQMATRIRAFARQEARMSRLTGYQDDVLDLFARQLEER